MAALASRLPLARPFIRNAVRQFSTGSLKQAPCKVTVCGACGGIGQPLSLLLKQSSLISELRLYDVKNAIGVAADLSDIDTPPVVTGYMGEKEVEKALKDTDIVAIVAGMPRKPGMTRDDLFGTNAKILASIATSCAKHCPSAYICVVTNPVNSTLPIACEIMKHYNVFDENKVLGVSTLDSVRASNYIARKKNLPVAEVVVPVVAGHSGETIIPLISQCKPHVDLPQDEIAAITKRIQEAGTIVVNAKAGDGSATLSMAYAAARFIFSLLEALNGKKNVVECMFLHTDKHETPYFAEPCLLGTNGIEKRLGIGELSDYERKILTGSLPSLKKNIEKGIKFAQEYVKNL